MNIYFAKRLIGALTLALLAGGCASTGEQRSSGEVVDDASISTKVKTALLADGTTDGLDIEVEVDRGRVQLNGFADSAAERTRAGDIAREVAGVVAVSNNLEVGGKSRRVGEYLDDKVLATRIAGALAKDPDVKSMQVDVEINRGVVLLGGFVDTAKQRRAAEAAAKRVDGVERVVNNLVVR